METSRPAEGFENRLPTVPISEIPIPKKIDPALADFPFRMGEVIEQFRLARSFPRRYFDRIEEVRRSAREFSELHIRPRALEIEAAVSADPGYVAWDVLNKACDYGFYSMVIPKPFGGGGYNVLHMAVMAEELAVGCAGLATTIGVHSAGISCGMISLDAWILENYIRPVAEAERRGEPILWSGAVTEPGAGTDIWDEEFLGKGTIGTFATKVDGGYVINGRKCFISNGSVSKFTVVLAALDRGDPAGSWTAFLVPTDSPGFSVGRVERKMGQKASPTSEQVFEDVFVDENLMIGLPGSGARAVSIYLAGSRGPVGAIGVGCARRALECLIDWATTKRNPHGRLIDQQAIQMEISQMSREIVTARQAYVASSLACDRIFMAILGNPLIKLVLNLTPGALLRSKVGRLVIKSRAFRTITAAILDRNAPMDRLCHISALATTAKIIGSDAGVRVSGRAMEIMGPDCLDPRWPVEKAYRDARLTRIYEGTNGANAITHFKNMIGLMGDDLRPPAV